MSPADYARHRGIKRNAITGAIADGKITLEADGTIDVAAADDAWTESTNPAHAANDPKGHKPVTKAAIEAAKNVLRSAGAKVDDGPLTFTQARTAVEINKAQMGALRLKEKAGTLVERSRVTEAVFALARQERDSWLAFPARVSALLAADLKVDAHRMEIALDKAVKGHLRAIGIIDVARALQPRIGTKTA
jgi:hypothetical protein